MAIPGTYSLLSSVYQCGCALRKSESRYHGEREVTPTRLSWRAFGPGMFAGWSVATIKGRIQRWFWAGLPPAVLIESHKCTWNFNTGVWHSRPMAWQGLSRLQPSWTLTALTHCARHLLSYLSLYHAYHQGSSSYTPLLFAASSDHSMGTASPGASLAGFEHPEPLVSFPPGYAPSCCLIWSQGCCARQQLCILSLVQLSVCGVSN